MRKLFSVLFLAGSIMFLFSCKSAPDSDQAVVDDAQEVEKVSSDALTLAIKPAESQVAWIGTKVTGRHNGTIGISEGSFSVKNGVIEGGTFTLDMTSLQSTDPNMDEENNGKLTGHLRSPDFFDVETFPTAVFELTAASAAEGVAETEGSDEFKLADPTHTLTGNLTMRGVTKSISFPAKVEMTDAGLAGVAKFNINRQDWGVAYTGMKDDIINDIVHLGIGIAAGQ